MNLNERLPNGAPTHTATWPADGGDFKFQVIRDDLDMHKVLAIRVDKNERKENTPVAVTIQYDVIYPHFGFNVPAGYVGYVTPDDI